MGGGVAGLGSALALARAGHEVTVLERDDTPMPSSADDAFEWDRRGAPQVRQSHAFLARLTNLLRDHYPDVLAELLAAGATEIRFGEDLPPSMVGFVPEPEDVDLTMIACRRTTFEWIVRRAAMAEGNVAVRTGVAVDGLLAVDRRGARHPPRRRRALRRRHDDRGGARDRRRRPPLRRVRVAHGDRRSRRSPRRPRTRASCTTPASTDCSTGRSRRPARGPIGGDLGYLKYGVFAGDRRTFSVTLATPVADDELRRLFVDPASSTPPPVSSWSRHRGSTAGPSRSRRRCT